MTTGKLVYTDGHRVTVTDSTIRVDNTQYRLDGIIRHSFSIIKPRRIPIVMVISIGIAFLSLGFFDLVPRNLIHSLEIGSIEVSTRLLSLGFGTLMVLAGVSFLAIEKERYGVNIVTAEGEKNVIVSKKREYITMIDDALAKAMERWKF